MTAPGMTQAGDWTPERVTITLSSGTVYEYWPDVTDGYPWLCNADKESGSQSWGTIASVCRAIRTMEDFQKVAAASQGTTRPSREQIVRLRDKIVAQAHDLELVMGGAKGAYEVVLALWDTPEDK